MLEAGGGPGGKVVLFGGIQLGLEVLFEVVHGTFVAALCGL